MVHRPEPSISTRLLYGLIVSTLMPHSTANPVTHTPNTEYLITDGPYPSNDEYDVYIEFSNADAWGNLPQLQQSWLDDLLAQNE